MKTQDQLIQEAYISMFEQNIDEDYRLNNLSFKDRSNIEKKALKVFDSVYNKHIKTKGHSQAHAEASFARSKFISDTLESGGPTSEYSMSNRGGPTSDDDLKMINMHD